MILLVINSFLDGNFAALDDTNVNASFGISPKNKWKPWKYKDRVSVVTKVSGVGRSIIGGGGAIFIYSCSQTLKTIEFKRS